MKDSSRQKTYAVRMLIYHDCRERADQERLNESVPHTLHHSVEKCIVHPELTNLSAREVATSGSPWLTRSLVRLEGAPLRFVDWINDANRFS